MLYAYISCSHVVPRIDRAFRCVAESGVFPLCALNFCERMRNSEVKCLINARIRGERNRGEYIHAQPEPEHHNASFTGE